MVDTNSLDKEQQALVEKKKKEKKKGGEGGPNQDYRITLNAPARFFLSF